MVSRKGWPETGEDGHNMRFHAPCKAWVLWDTLIWERDNLYCNNPETSLLNGRSLDRPARNRYIFIFALHWAVVEPHLHPLDVSLISDTVLKPFLATNQILESPDDSVPLQCSSPSFRGK